MKSLFIFRRDFRLHDNIALHCLANDPRISAILPIFIFDPFQIDETARNKWYRSAPAMQFMMESLDNLQEQFADYLNISLSKKTKQTVRYFYDQPIEVLTRIHKHYPFEVLAFNRDFSEYSLKRDQAMIDWCNEHNIQIITDSDTAGYEDLTLHPMEQYIPDSGNPYVIFGSFYKRAVKLGEPQIHDFPKRKNIIDKFKISGLRAQIPGQFTKDIHSFYKDSLSANYQPKVRGGRANALQILAKVRANEWRDYPEMRDDLAYETTHLSAYLKFGCVSIREVYKAFKERKMEALMRQLYWRCFFFVLSRYKHHGYEHSDPFFAKINWRNDIEEAKQMWVKARTGFPVIDACVRELLTTGYLHNRGRLLVANFSIKMLHIDPFHPQWGGQVVFSRLLLDNCYANNYGNWNNALGPYDLPGFRFGKKGTRSGRIFRDIVKFQKWDKTLAYIRHYVPELADVPDKDIYRWNTQWKKYKQTVDYPEPMMNFDERIRKYFDITKR